MRRILEPGKNWIQVLGSLDALNTNGHSGTGRAGKGNTRNSRKKGAHMEMMILQFFLFNSLLLTGTQNPAPSGDFQMTRPVLFSIGPPESQQAEEANEVEVVVISPIGFEPKEITRPKGAFILDVVNLSGLDELSVKVTVEPGRGQNSNDRPIYEGTVSMERQDWNVKVNLPPGRYQIVEALHPSDLNWILMVNIQ